jgi:dTDP-4-dehydrorhamnose 3,5-epimerase
MSILFIDAKQEFMNFSIENPPIHGVEVKKLVSHGDDRGFFREIIRNTDDFFISDPEVPTANFGQWSHSKMIRHTIKAWHYHHKQTDWWYICGGHARVGLIDNRPESPTYRAVMDFLMGDDTDSALTASVRIPPGVLHGCRVLSDYAHLFYVTSHTYDPKDEGRIPFNAAEVDFHWGDESGIIVAPNDTRYFSPDFDRVL